MKIVKLMGGLGNQMFQYAFGMGMANQCGTDVTFDTSFFTTPISDDTTPRNYELGLFPNLKIKHAKQYDVEKFTKSNPVRRFMYKIVTEDSPFDFSPRVMSCRRRNAYFKGYFQDERYFAHISDAVRHAFEFPPIAKSDRHNCDIANKIRQCENPVFIHIRRGDYLKLDGWTLGIEYYRRAVRHIIQTVKNPVFFVFGAECDDFIKNSFDIGCDFIFVGNKNTQKQTDFRDMQLMSMCRHGIIANSSFSWWAAWLMKNPKKIICAPSPWIKQDAGIICQSWIKIAK